MTFPPPSFTAVAAGKTARLNWTTVSEIDNDYFGVERSTDGNVWTSIGRVAAGETSGPQHYDFIDATPTIGMNYYRLRQTDLDGTTALSDVRTVSFGGDDVLSVDPNPTADVITLRGVPAGKTVTVLDAAGKRFTRLVTGETSTVSTREWPAGVYVLLHGGTTTKLVVRR